jgi:hypothetical protein
MVQVEAPPVVVEERVEVRTIPLLLHHHVRSTRSRRRLQPDLRPSLRCRNLEHLKGPNVGWMGVMSSALITTISNYIINFNFQFIIILIWFKFN